MRLYHLYGSLTVLYLSMSIATEANPIAIHPLNRCQQLCYIVSYQSRVHSLIEIYGISLILYLLQLSNSIVACSQDIIIHKHDFPSAFNSYLVNIHIRLYGSLFLRYHAPWAFIRASARQKSVCGIFGHVEYIIQWLQPVNIIG